jgi:predicted dehydrogenase
MSHSASHRRTFLKHAAAIGIAAPYFIRNLRAAPPSETVRHATFGASGMAGADVRSIASHSAVKLVCAAEVDSNRAAELQRDFPGIKVYADYREMLDKEHKNLDCVNVSTPDHMHAPMAMSAMQVGLHVYGQKPLSHDVYESRRLTEFAREKKLITQMGIQIHSSVEYRTAVQLVQEGAIGLIEEVHTFSDKKWGDSAPKPDRKDAVPANLKWDLWLGVVSERPYIEGYYHPGVWRKRVDFGTGTFGDMGCHIYDPVYEALALTDPLSIRSEGAAPNGYNWATDAIVHYVFPGTKFTAGKTVSVTWYDGDRRPPQRVQEWVGNYALPGQGSVLRGTKGIMVIPHVGRPVLLPQEKFQGVEFPQLKPVNHYHQFVEAVRGNGKTSAGFDYSGPLTEAILLGSIASRFPQTTLEWNAKEMKFPNQAEANQYVRRTYREGWNVPGLSDA